MPRTGVGGEFPGSLPWRWSLWASLVRMCSVSSALTAKGMILLTLPLTPPPKIKIKVKFPAIDQKQNGCVAQGGLYE